MQVPIEPMQTLTFAILTSTGVAYRLGPYFRDGVIPSITNQLTLSVGTAGWSGLLDNPQFNPRAPLVTVAFQTQCQGNNNVYLRHVLERNGCSA
jgi:hypothetical protein